jgi:hypothetical protein
VSTLAIVLIVLAALIVLLGIGGAIANGRRRRAGDATFPAHLERADHDLAEAYAVDKGWQRERLEDAVRRAWAGDAPAEDDVELLLLEVVDLPGTDEDMAVFRVRAGERSGRVTLHREGDTWRPERVTRG